MRAHSLKRAHALTRRELLLAASAGGLLRGEPVASRFSLEGYIWQNWAQRQKRTLTAVTGDAIPMTRAAGYRNIELNEGFFVPEIRERVLALTRKSIADAFCVCGRRHASGGTGGCDARESFRDWRGLQVFWVQGDPE